jgi:GTP 3',8-cyclase
MNPYLTIAITNACNFKCKYCSPDGNGGMGEGYGTKSKKVDLEDLEEKIKIANSLSITKVRFTGGEPLMVKGITNLLKKIDRETNMEYSLSTNGSLVHEHINELVELDRLDLRVSLDTLKEDKFTKICGVDSKEYRNVMDNIKTLSERGFLQRIAAVITKDNIDEIDEILDFCEGYNINLKLFDMYSTDITKDVWNYFYSPLNVAKKIVDKRTINKRQIEYTKKFGIPSQEYELKSGIKVRIKDSTSGTRYHEEFCKGCNLSSCQEGLYTILYSSDQKLIPCRLSPVHYKADTKESFEKNLKELVGIFKGAYHENKFWS